MMGPWPDVVLRDGAAAGLTKRGRFMRMFPSIGVLFVRVLTIRVPATFPALVAEVVSSLVVWTPVSSSWAAPSKHLAPKMCGAACAAA